MFTSPTVVEMSVVQLSYNKLLEEISKQLGIETPQCKVTVAAEGWLLAYIDLLIAYTGTIIEIVRCWCAPSPDFIVAREDAAHVATMTTYCTKICMTMLRSNILSCLVNSIT